MSTWREPCPPTARVVPTRPCLRVYDGNILFLQRGGESPASYCQCFSCLMTPKLNRQVIRMLSSLLRAIIDSAHEVAVSFQVVYLYESGPAHTLHSLEKFVATAIIAMQPAYNKRLPTVAHPYLVATPLSDPAPVCHSKMLITVPCVCTSVLQFKS